MKTVRKNNLIKKIAIIILFIMSFNILIPNCSVNAKSWAETTANSKEDYTPGGSLFQPIMDFLVFLADSILNVLQHNFISETDVVYSQVDSASNSTFGWGWLGAALLGVVAVAYGIACIYTGGAAAAISTVITGVLWSVGGVAVTVYSVGQIVDLEGGQFDIPYIAYNPYAIFSGDIPALDINFINPREAKVRDTIDEIDAMKLFLENTEKYSNIISTWEESTYINTGFIKIYSSGNEEPEDMVSDFKEQGNFIEHSDYQKKTIEKTWESGEKVNGTIYPSDGYENITITFWEDNEEIFIIWHSHFHSEPAIIMGVGVAGSDSYTYKCFSLNDEEFIEKFIEQTIEDNTTYYQSSAAILQSSISTWYNVLRRIALVGLLSVLVYVGIRIVISAAAADKAKYKKMFLDWLTAVCILFVLHYVMVLILTVSTNLTELFHSGAVNMTAELPADTTMNGELLIEKENLEQLEYNEYNKITVEEGEDGKGAYPLWNGEFMGYIRLRAGGTYVRNQMAYGLMYLVLVIYVCMFTFMYLRRVLYMAFLTMIAPLIALTYPLDKIKDGQAQAFSLWLREYIFNALIQPVHLILYTMLISNALSLAEQHPVYALVALGFMLPAEKFIRSMFGFQKASTLNNLGGAFGGAALMGVVNKLAKLGKKKNGGSEGKGTEKIRTADKNVQGIDLPDVNGGGVGNIENSSPRMTNNTPLPDAELPQSGRNTVLSGSTASSNIFAQQASRAQANNNELSRGNRFKNAVTSMANRGKNRILKAKPLRTVGRFTAMGAGAAALGMVGLAAGISTGDFGNVLKYTGAGMGVGGALGKSIGDSAMDKGSQIIENFREGYQGSEEYNNEKLDKEYFNGQGYQDMLDNNSLMPNLSGSERAHALREEIEEYRANGFSENKQIASCIKAGLSSEEGVLALQMSSKLKGMNLDSAGKEAYKTFLKEQCSVSSSKIDNIWKVIEANM